jgi:hypothetical protein
MEYLADAMQEQFDVLQERLLTTSGADAPTVRGASAAYRGSPTDFETSPRSGHRSVGERGEPVEILGSGSDLRVFLAVSLAHGSLIGRVTSADLLGMSMPSSLCNRSKAVSRSK